MTQIGYLKKMHGVKGALVLKLLDKMHFLGKVKDAIFIELQGNNVPYFIDEMGGSHPEWILKLNTVNHLDAGKMVGAKVFAMTDKFVVETSFSEEHAFLVSYTFIDQLTQLKGVITAIEEMTYQTILYVTINEKEVLVPLNADWIIEIDKPTKQIIYNCPEGLIEIYLA